MTNENLQKITELLNTAKNIVIIQADNPDADSLGSSLALEQILSEMGKQVHLYCGVDMPMYLQHLEGYDRVSHELPHQFDLSIIVDASTTTLLEKLRESGQQGWIASKPCIVLDHHNTTANDISYAAVVINEGNISSTGELIYNIAKHLEWPLDVVSGGYVMSAILGDTQGLTNDLASAQTYRVMADLTDLGVDRPKLEEARRELSKMNPIIFKYKAVLIERSDLLADGKIASVVIPQTEISQYSPLYNPAPLIQADMLNTKGVAVALVFKYYKDGKILCSIRCNPGYGIAADLAVGFGGGGHAYASGFKVQDGRPFNEIRSECIQKATELLGQL